MTVHFADHRKGHRSSDRKHDLCRQCWRSVTELLRTKQRIEFSNKRDRGVRNAETRLKEVIRRAGNYQAEKAWEKEYDKNRAG